MIKYILAGFLWAGIALAHMAPEGWHYDAWCCNDADCRVAEPKWVTVRPEGYFIRILPGEHPMVTVPFEAFVPKGSDVIRKSQDYEFHICIYPQNTLRCFYETTGGT